MKIWKARYKDEKHNLDVDIINTEGDYWSYPLTMTINGTEFHATSPTDFELSYPESYDFSSGEFNLLKWGGKNTKHNYETPYLYTLQRYSLDFEIPFPVLNRSAGKIEDSFLHIAFKYRESLSDKDHNLRSCDGRTVCGDIEELSDFSLHVGGEVYSCISKYKKLYTPSSLIAINKMIKEKYEMRCCFSCQYSDYSPYGGDDFGNMMCYRNHKQEYLKVNDKDSWFEYAEGLDFEIKQEIFLFEEYEPRIHCAGYRGYID